MLSILERGTYWYESIELLVTKGLLATSKLPFINVPGGALPEKLGGGACCPLTLFMTKICDIS